MRLEAAQDKARLFLDCFGRYFQRLEIAGSIRRQKAEVKDIELVGILPNDQRELFVHAIDIDNRFQCLKPNTTERIPWPIKRDGKYWRFAFMEQGDEIKIDLFLAEPDNFGWIYLIRTGPGGQDGFSAFCCARWKSVGPRGPNGQLPKSEGGFLCTGAGVRVPTPEEADVFRLLHFISVPPEKREEAVLTADFYRDDRNRSSVAPDRSQA